MERAGFSPDGRRVVTAARDGTARIWDAVSGAQRSVLEPVGDYPTAVFDPKGDRVLTAGGHTQATLWNPWTGNKILSVASIGDGTGRLQPGRSQLCDFISNAAFLSGMRRMAR